MGADPDKLAHRTYKTLEPDGEIAVVQRPEGKVKLLFYTCSGAEKTCHSEITLTGSLQFRHGNFTARLPRGGS